MKSKSNKHKFAGVIGTFNLAEITSVKTDDEICHLHKTDMTIVLVWSEYELHTKC